LESTFFGAGFTSEVAFLGLGDDLDLFAILVAGNKERGRYVSR